MVKHILSLLTVLLFLSIINTASAQSPSLHTDDISIRSVAESPFESVKISFNRIDQQLYILTQSGDIHRLNLESGSTTVVQGRSNHGLENVQGIDISSTGTFFIVGNSRNDQDYTNTAVIKRGTIVDGSWNWETVAQSAPYPLSNTDFDHIMNEIVVGPDDRYVYVNSGSRTDHGEEQSVNGLYPGLREAALTAKILKLPADSTNIYLENDEDFLVTNEYVFAHGTRNSFGLAFDGNGELFSADNAGERDDPGEFNWLQEGKHYGFPWRIGGNDTPMQFEGYNPGEDQLLSTDSRSEIFYNDPDYPPKPDIDFIEPILNYGPDAVNYKDPETGEVFNAAEQDTAISSFTGHRSSLGLVFDSDSTLGGDYNGDGFVLAFTGGNDPYFLLQFMDDPGEDLLHLELTKKGDTFEMNSKTLVSGFLNPIDSEIIGNKIYVLEFRNSWLNSRSTTRIWEVELPGNTTSNEPDNANIAQHFRLKQNYPNPFNPSTTLHYELKRPAEVRLTIFDALGRTIQIPVQKYQQNGSYSVKFDAQNLPSGIYFYRLTIDGQTSLSQTRKMLLLK